MKYAYSVELLEGRVTSWKDRESVLIQADFTPLEESFE
jgi:hypothetical protein